jgi:hypothetical protein
MLGWIWAHKIRPKKQKPKKNSRIFHMTLIYINQYTLLECLYFEIEKSLTSLSETLESLTNSTMAIISDYQDEEQTKKQIPPSSSSSQPKPSKSIPFTSTFDPSNPTAFLEKVFDFIAKESDFFEKDSAEKVILSAVRAAKVKKTKAVAAEKAKIAAEEKAKAEKVAAEAAKKDKEVESKEDEKKDQESSLAGKRFTI